MRLEQKNRRRTQNLSARIVAVRLRHDARLLREVRSQRMIEIVGILQRVRQNKLRLKLAINLHQLVQRVFAKPHRIIAHVDENCPCAQNLRRSHGFLLPHRLYFFDRHAWLAPKFCRFAALPKRKAHHRNLPAARRIQRDRSSGAPHEIGGMSAHDERSLLSYWPPPSPPIESFIPEHVKSVESGTSYVAVAFSSTVRTYIILSARNTADFSRSSFNSTGRSLEASSLRVLVAVFHAECPSPYVRHTPFLLNCCPATPQ